MKGFASKKIFSSQITIVTLILIALVIFFSIGANGFFSLYNLKTVLQQTAVIGILAIAETIVIITAGIDLSAGALIGMTTIVCGGMMVDMGFSLVVGIIVSLAIAVGVGIINGLLVAYLNLPAFIATLGTQYVVSSIALLTKGGNDIYNLPSIVAKIGRGSIGGAIPYLAIIMLAVVVVSHLMLSKFSWGRYVYACGSNLTAARFSGVKTKKVLLSVYTLSGFICGIAGLVMMFRINAGVAVSGDGYEMNGICACVIGGGSMFGGKGSALGTLVGALIMSVLSSGLQIMGFSTYWQQLITGIVLIIAVLIDTMRQMRSHASH